ncbi:MAG TPA: amidohydrolase family protein [Candidatus Limnocylindria bacterium]|nr:amidohydrolase family protein [Candidatus Limnocylindria bacterium]
MNTPWNLKQQMLEAIAAKGGWVNCHAHFDKAFYITKDGLDKSTVDMEVKWTMSDGIKRASSQAEIETRIRTALDILIAQGCKLTCSFIDAYDAVGHKAIDAANKVKEEYREKIELLTITQPLGGLIDPAARKLYEEITAKADIAGGLPSKDRPNDGENLDILFSIAKNLNKPLHVHIDQENNPNERDTEKLINATIKHGYEGRVVAVHAISTSAQPKEYRGELYKKMAGAGMAVAVCPGAALGMRQLDQLQSNVHNSIANVPEMLEAGIVVGMGVDNVYDFYQPFIDADMWVEMRMLQEACRFYDFEKLVDIATVNGKKLLSIK